MPIIQINMAAGRTQEQKRALLRAVTGAVQESIGAPLSSIRVWINEFAAAEFIAGGEILAERGAASDTAAERGTTEIQRMTNEEEP